MAKSSSNTACAEVLVSIVLDNLQVQAAQGKAILKGISGAYGPSEFVAVMGPSGSGKTTLLDVISGAASKEMTITGSITANGIPVDNTVIEACVRRVPQDDLLFPTMTPIEILVSRATMAGYGTPHEALTIAEELLERFDMESARDVNVGDARGLGNTGLSGGQKRRLSVALELISRPAVLILDEPTSGLDVITASNLTKHLAALAREEGTTVICSIHQPSASIFFTFHKLLVLKGGVTVYNGPIEGRAADPSYKGPMEPLVTFKNCGFECPQHHNPADFVLEVVTMAPADQLAAIAAACVKLAAPVPTATLTLPPPPKSSFSVDLMTLLRRHFSINFRDRGVLGARLLAPMLIALLVGGLFYDIPDAANPLADATAFSFMPLMFFTMSPHASTLGVMLPELAIVKKEVKNSHYSVKTYYLAKCLIELPLLLLGPILFATVAGTMAGVLMTGWRLFAFYGALASNALVSYAWTISICCIVPNAETATVLGPALIGPFVLFCGFLRPVELEPWPLRWISYIDYLRYTYEMSVFSLFKDQDISEWAGTVAEDGTQLTWQDLLADIGITNTEWSYYGRQMGITMAWFVSFLILGYISLVARLGSAALSMSTNKVGDTTTPLKTPTEASVTSTDEKKA